MSPAPKQTPHVDFLLTQVVQPSWWQISTWIDHFKGINRIFPKGHIYVDLRGTEHDTYDTISVNAFDVLFQQTSSNIKQ